MKENLNKEKLKKKNFSIIIFTPNYTQKNIKKKL